MTTAPVPVATQPADLVYVRRSKCQFHLQPLNMQPAAGDLSERVARVGQVRECPDCGRTWHAVQKIAWGGIVQLEWQCYQPPGTPDDAAAAVAGLAALTARVQALESRAGTDEATLSALQSWAPFVDAHLAALDDRTSAAEGRLTAAEGRLTAVEARTTALEARTVSVHRAVWAPTVAIAVGKTDVAVAWSTAFTAAFPDANYKLEVVVIPTLASRVTAVEKSRTKDGVVIALTSTVLVAVGTNLLDVTATRFAA